MALLLWYRRRGVEDGIDPSSCWWTKHPSLTAKQGRRPWLNKSCWRAGARTLIPDAGKHTSWRYQSGSARGNKNNPKSVFGSCQFPSRGKNNNPANRGVDCSMNFSVFSARRAASVCIDGRSSPTHCAECGASLDSSRMWGFQSPKCKSTIIINTNNNKLACRVSPAAVAFLIATLRGCEAAHEKQV